MKDKYYEQAVTYVRPVWKDTYVYAITEDEYENRKMSGTADGIL